jgi:probable nitrogen fixation protein FixT
VRPIYLDNNATTRTDPSVVAAMLPFFSEQFGNASSSHAFGSEVAGSLKAARRSVQALIGAAFDHEIVFTSGGTESDNTAILSALAMQEGRDEIVTTAVEHPAVLSLVEELGRRGIKSHLIPVDTHGRLDIEAYRRALGPRTAIASVMWANNETGTVFPVEFLAEMARSVGSLFHTDAVQAVGRIPIDVKTTGIDMLSLSGHKLHGPKGVGALYVRKGIRFKSMIFGGPQERRRRAVGAGADPDRRAARSAGAGYPEARPLHGARRCQEPVAEHGQRRLRASQGRGDHPPSQSRRHCGIARFGLRLRLDGAVACAACDEPAAGIVARCDPLFAVARNDGGRDRSCARDAPRHHCETESIVPFAGGARNLSTHGDEPVKVMIRRSPETGLSIYVPKKDLEEPIVESEHETLWGGWIKIANGWVLDLPQMASDTTLPITINAKKRGGDGDES